LGGRWKLEKAKMEKRPRIIVGRLALVNLSLFLSGEEGCAAGTGRFFSRQFAWG
jgi:hypothetical protein